MQKNITKNCFVSGKKAGLLFTQEHFRIFTFLLLLRKSNQLLWLLPEYFLHKYLCTDNVLSPKDLLLPALHLTEIERRGRRSSRSRDKTDASALTLIFTWVLLRSHFSRGLEGVNSDTSLPSSSRILEFSCLMTCRGGDTSCNPHGFGSPWPLTPTPFSDLHNKYPNCCFLLFSFAVDFFYFYFF